MSKMQKKHKSLSWGLNLIQLFFKSRPSGDGNNCSVSLFISLHGFANGPGNQGSIPDRVILKTQKMVHMPPCLTHSIIRYRSRVSGAI